MIKINVTKFISRKVVLWSLFFLIILLQVLFAIQTATSGATIASIETKEKELYKENKHLANELVKSTSLTEIKKGSEELGFYKPENTWYLNIEEFVAKVP